MSFPIPQPPKPPQPSGLALTAGINRGGTTGRLNIMHKPGTLASGGRNPFATPAKQAGAHTREMYAHAQQRVRSQRPKAVQNPPAHPQSDATLASELLAALGLHPPQP